MTIEETRKCNRWNIDQVASFFEADSRVLNEYYDELLEDSQFLSELNLQLNSTREERGFSKGIFGAQEKLSTIDWFAFERVLIYVLTRFRQPEVCLETGVFYGGNTAFLLNALEKNGRGKLISIDYPDSALRRDGVARHPLVGDSELYQPDLTPGFLVPERLHKFWDLVIGDSHMEIPKIKSQIDFYVHDSEHSYGFLKKEIELAYRNLSCDGCILVDDIDWSNGFISFCVEQRMFPLFLTDNGKDNLRVRTGLAWRGHPKNDKASFTMP